MTALEALARAPLFEGFSETGLRIFATIAQERALAAGAPLFAEGDVAEALYVVKSGALRILQRTPAGEREVATLGPGEHVGELSLLAPGVRLVSAAAAAATEVVEIGRRAFFRTAQEKPQACLKLSLLIAADLSRRIGQSRDLLKDALARAAQGSAG
jgi:CRP/FNR family transcriptional regulator, cyclic AMP receptor protein